jgi:hypothetical protein
MTLLLVALAGCGGLGCDSMCEDYLDEPPGETLTLRYQNAGSSTLFVGMASGCSGLLLPFDVRPVGGTDLTLIRTGCNTCETLQEGEQACPAMCAMPPIMRLEPGGSYEVTWDARHWIAAMMPDSCYADIEYATCTQHVVLQPGAYELTAYVYPDCNPAGTSACDCTASSEGWCRVEMGGSPTGTRLTSTVTFDYPPSASSPAVHTFDLSFP